MKDSFTQMIKKKADYIKRNQKPHKYGAKEMSRLHYDS